MILESSQLYPAFEVVVLMLNGTLVPQFGTLYSTCFGDHSHMDYLFIYLFTSPFIFLCKYVCY